MKILNRNDEFRLYDNGTFHIASTHSKVERYISVYGLFTYSDSQLGFDPDIEEFFDENLEIIKAENKDSIATVSFKEFIPYGLDYQIKSLAVLGVFKNGDVVVLEQLHKKNLPTNYQKVEFQIPTAELQALDSLWVERDEHRKGYPLCNEQFLNAKSISYPVIFHKGNFLVLKPTGYWETTYIKLSRRNDNFIFRNFTQEYDPFRTKYHKVE